MSIQTDTIDGQRSAGLACEKCPEHSHLHDQVAGALRELVRHPHRLSQGFYDRVRRLHRLLDLGFAEFTRYVRSLTCMTATCLLAAYRTAHALGRAKACRPAKLRYDGRNFVCARLAK